MDKINTIQWKNNKLVLIDCRKLPSEEVYYACNNHIDVAESIENLIVRGAPAIGIAAAYGVVLASLEKPMATIDELILYLNKAIKRLSQTRPTAVNLFWALDRMRKVIDTFNLDSKKELLINKLIKEANDIFQEDILINKKIGFYGNQIVKPNSNIITHCNAGALATAGYGTALGVIRAASESNKNIHIYVDETRPLLQGSRLTAWELIKENISCTLITDSTAGYLMSLDKVDLVIFGADRIAANGDVANKIGSYSLSVLSKAHNIPLYVAAPTSTIDLEIKTGKDIIVEQRDEDEVRYMQDVLTAPEKVKVFNPAFDIVPYQNISGIITEKGIVRYPFIDMLKKIKP